MPEHTEPKYTGRLVIRLAPPVVDRIAARAKDAALPDWASLQELLRDLGLDKALEVFQRYPGFRSYPSVRGTRASRILQREERIRKSAAGADKAVRLPRSLTSYYTIDVREWKDDALAERFLAELNALPKEVVELAYREHGVRPATNSPPGAWAVNPGDPLVSRQGYLNLAPEGIGANTEEVWGFFDGSNIGFVDLEAGWNLSHQELPISAAGRVPIINVNYGYWANHGTSVLGVVLGKADGAGITGIAPRANFRGVTSYIANLNPIDVDVVGAIEAAMDVLQRGDVLLLEVESALRYPIETDERVFIAIAEAVLEGIIVIEAAGNGDAQGRGYDLDKPMPRKEGDPPPVNLKRDSREFQDSGAVMVSACAAKVTPSSRHRRLPNAGYGSRVDCYAWGEQVFTAGGPDVMQAQDPNGEYTNSFSGTSAASAIIAGATLLVQQMAVDSGQGLLDSIEMRSKLSKAGTEIMGPGGSQVIGRMPDLRVIAKDFVTP